MTIALISHLECLLHRMGTYHPEQPARLEVINDELVRRGLSDILKYYDAPLATEEQLLRVHSSEHIETLFSVVPEEGLVFYGPDVYLSPNSLRAALRAAGSGVLAVDLIMAGEVQQAFCNVRPPGHHAEQDLAMGFCFFNNIAIAVAHALEQHKLKRIAIVDFDVHHGNGTEKIFRHDSRVLYCSSFESPFYPFSGEGTKSSHIINIPLPAGTKGETFRAKTAQLWFEQIRHFAPQMLFISAGFDGYFNDPIGDFLLTEKDYFWITHEVKQIANEHCQGRVVSLLEGGYALNGLGICVAAHIQGLND